MTPPHAADGVLQRGFPGDEMTGVDGEAAVHLALDDRPIRREEEIALPGALDQKGALAREQRFEPAELRIERYSRRAAEERSFGEIEGIALHFAVQHGPRVCRRQRHKADVIGGVLGNEERFTAKRFSKERRDQTAEQAAGNLHIAAHSAHRATLGPERFPGRQSNSQIAEIRIATDVEFHAGDLSRCRPLHKRDSEELS